MPYDQMASSEKIYLRYPIEILPKIQGQTTGDKTALGRLSRQFTLRFPKSMSVAPEHSIFSLSIIPFLKSRVSMGVNAGQMISCFGREVD